MMFNQQIFFSLNLVQDLQLLSQKNEMRDEHLKYHYKWVSGIIWGNLRGFAISFNFMLWVGKWLKIDSLTQMQALPEKEMIF